MNGPRNVRSLKWGDHTINSDNLAAVWTGYRAASIQPATLHLATPGTMGMIGDLANLEPISRLVMALGTLCPERRVVLVLVCKLDASGTTDADNDILTIGGYLAMLHPWMEFEVLARKYLDDHGVGVLRAKEFYDTDDDFKGWSRTKKETFVRGIQDNLILRRMDLGIAMSITKSAYLQAKHTHNVAHNESAFGFCFRMILDKLLGDVVVRAMFAKGYDLSIVLESGDANAGDACRVWNQVKAITPEYDQALHSIGFLDKKKSVGLQIGDFLAGTTRRYVRKYDESGYPEEPTILSILRDRIYLIAEVATDFPRIERPQFCGIMAQAPQTQHSCGFLAPLNLSTFWRGGRSAPTYREGVDDVR